METIRTPRTEQLSNWTAEQLNSWTKMLLWWILSLTSSAGGHPSIWKTWRRLQGLQCFLMDKAQSPDMHLWLHLTVLQKHASSSLVVLKELVNTTGAMQRCSVFIYICAVGIPNETWVEKLNSTENKNELQTKILQHDEECIMVYFSVDIITTKLNYYSLQHNWNSINIHCSWTITTFNGVEIASASIAVELLQPSTELKYH